jgi:hypothetical protein
VLTSGVFLFWLAFLQGLSAPRYHILLLSLFHSMMLLVVPRTFGFTYVQTALIFMFTCYDLMRVDKNDLYDIAAVIVTLPIGFMAWLEAFGCHSVLSHIGGHVCYDLTITISLSVYFIIILFRAKYIDDDKLK